MIKYIGSKRLLTPLIQRVAGMLPVQTACDLFAGTTRVGQALREAGIEVISNDLATYSEVFGHTYVEAGPGLDRDLIRSTLAHLGSLPPRRGYVTRVFCEQARYFHPDNGMRIDAVREEIDRLALDRIERSVLLTSLVEAADRVDSTVGLQMAYLKQWAPRALRPLELREPLSVPGPPGRTTRRDANELAATLTGIDLAYLDPPYNQHSYFRNYHVWETLVRNDRPEHYGVACKRQDARSTVSRFNSRRDAWPALSELIERLPTPWVLLSFSDEGFHDLSRVHDLLGERGYVTAVGVNSKRYVGAQIGIHNPRGERTGTVSHVRNTEVLFVCGPDRAVIEAVTTELAQTPLRVAV